MNFDSGHTEDNEVILTYQNGEKREEKHNIQKQNR